jgi:hypothetical protein
MVRRKTGGGDGTGSVFGDAVQGGLEALFGKLSELLGDRLGGWLVHLPLVERDLCSDVDSFFCHHRTSSATDFVKAKAAPVQANLENTAEKYHVVGYANSALRFVFGAAETIFDMLPTLFPGKGAQQVGYATGLDKFGEPL